MRWERSAKRCRTHGGRAHTEELAGRVSVDERLCVGGGFRGLGVIVRDDGPDLVSD